MLDSGHIWLFSLFWGVGCGVGIEKWSIRVDLHLINKIKKHVCFYVVFQKFGA